MFFNKFFQKLIHIFSLTLLYFSCPIFLSCKKPERTVYNFAPEKSKQLTVYSAINSWQTKLLCQEFEKSTGIWVKTYTDKAPQIYEQISEETDADILLCYASDAISLFDEQIDSYVKNNSLVPRPFGKKNLAAFAITQTVFLYNGFYFNMNENPFDGEKSISKMKASNLLATLDPYLSSENYACLFYLLNTTPISMLSEISITFSNAEQACESVAEGYYSAIVIPENIAISFKSSHPSSQISMIVPQNPSYIIETGTILKICKNKDNAERFIAFLQNLGTQSFLSQELKYHPVRKDMKLSDEDKNIIANALTGGLSDTESQLKNKTEFLQQWLKKTTGSEK